MSRLVKRFETMLASGQDNALLRFSLGNAYLDSEPAIAADHLRRALEFDPDYSAAWKQLGRALVAADDAAGAIAAWERGIEVAERRGDKQAVREMQVFLRRLQRE